MEDPLLLDFHRQKLAGPMIRNKQRREHERLLLSIAAAAANKRFTFSYPRIDVGQSRPRVPSLYALETTRAALGHLPELRSFQEKAAQAAPSRLDRPAPIEFEDAIDDAEYDLVALHHALHRKGKEKLGAMAYLTRVSEPLARSLRARYRQWEIGQWTIYDGLIVPEAERNPVLHAYRLSARPYSATTLQAFAACPYRFALLGMYGLRPRDRIQPLNQMDPLTRGALFHEAQREFFQRAQSAHLLPVTPANLQPALQALDDALNGTAERYSELLAPAIARVWRAEIEEIRTDLHGWLQEVVTQAEWIPEHFELAFGLKDTDGRDRDSSPEPVELNRGIQIRGAIDLIERHAVRGTLRVVDHKTGKAPDKRFGAVGGGTSLQPLLYSLAAEKMLTARVESGRLFYCTQRGNYCSAEVQVTDQTRLRVYRALEIIDEAIASGMLPAAPGRNECTFCDCRCACGTHEELRARRKPPPDVLNELRSMP
jgi:RecB family exonuclease